MPPGTDHDSVYREWEMAVDNWTDPSCWRYRHTSLSRPRRRQGYQKSQEDNPEEQVLADQSQKRLINRFGKGKTS